MIRFIVSAATLYATCAASADLPRLAVLGVRPSGGIAQGQADLLTDLLADDLGRAGKWRVISNLEISTLIGMERQKQLSGCEESGCLVEMSQALGADWLVDGSVGTLGNLRVLTVRLFDAKRANVERRESLTVDDEGALVDGIHTLAARLTGVPAPSRVASRPRAGWFVLGAGALLALGGVGAGAGALSQYDGYKARPMDVSLHDSARTWGYVADGLYGTAVVAGVVALVMLVFHLGEQAGAP